MRTAFIAMVLVAAGAASLPAAERNVYYILDASGSMWAQMNGSTRIEIAKDLLLDRLPNWRDQDVNIGLVAYGHNTRGDCSDIEVLVELKPLDEAEFTRAIEGISPKGKTPIAASINLVADKLRVSEEAAHVILISDGEETCHPDPCQAVADLKALGIDFTMDVIGFDITEAERTQLQCLAAAAGGRYFTAADAPQLHEAIAIAEETEPVEKIAQNVQIVLDRSEGMRAPFEGQTKHAVALRHLERKLEGPAAAVENLSLRTFGGSCEDPNSTALAVPFATGNAKRILEHVEGIDLRGEPTLAASLLAAIDDFSDPARFEGVARRVVLFTGSRGACDPMLVREVYDLFQSARIQADVHLIAMDPPPDHVEDLERIVGATGGFIYTVRTEKELAQAMDRIFDIEPVLSGVTTITEMLNEAVNYLNDGIRRVEKEDYSGARQEVTNGKTLLFETRAQFTDLGERQSRETFRKLYGLAEASRELQEKGFQITEQLLEAHSQDDVAKWNALISDWNTSISSYNDNVRSMNSLLKSLD